jgi:hypothetical protein
MSASAIADALVTMLSATSAFGSGAVSKSSYKVLETSSASCAVVSPLSMTSIPTTFGSPRDRERLWTFRVQGFRKDTGDPDAVLSGVYAIIDAIVDCVEGDDTVQGTGEATGEFEMEHTPGEALIVGGAAWVPVFVDVGIKEWP